MLNVLARARISHLVDPLGARLARTGISPDIVTLIGTSGAVAGALVLFSQGWFFVGTLVIWFFVMFDMLDGALARATTATDRGGFLDIVADFTVYGGFVLAVAIAEPDARLACAALLVTYYVSGTAFLAWSSLAERRALETGDERSLRFVAGLAEGTETVIAYVLFCLLPGRAEEIAWGFAAIVAVTALQRTVFAARALRAEPRPPPGGAPR